MPSLMPTGKQQYFYPGSTSPLAGGQLFTYAAGTSTPKVTYQDAAGQTANTNPITLDSTGSALIFWSGSYKVVLKDSAGNTVYTVDNYNTDLAANLQAQLAATPGASMVGFTQPGTGAAARMVQDKLRESVSVKDFGAKGDGVTDDAPAIQAAINSGAGSVYFPTGTYMIGTMLTGVSNQRLFAESFRSVTIKALVAMNALIFWSTQNNICIENIKFDGNNNVQSCVRSYVGAANATGFTAKGCHFTGTKNDTTLQYGGIEISQSGGRTNQVTVTNNYFDTLGSHGCLIAYADYVVFSGNKLSNIGQHGMEAVTCTHVVESDNVIYNCGTVGPGGSGLGIGGRSQYYTVCNNVLDTCKGDAPITIESTSNFGSVRGNTISNSLANAGINVSWISGTPNTYPYDALHDIIIEGNVVINSTSATWNGAYGINAYSSSGVFGTGIIIRGNVFDGFARGVNVSYLKHFNISDNVISNLTTNGGLAVGVTYSQYGTVNNNVCDSVTQYGAIQLLNLDATHYCDWITCLGNNVLQCGPGGNNYLFYIEGPGHHNLSNNWTGGATGYVNTTAASVVQLSGNFGQITGAAYLAGSGSIVNAIGNYNGASDFVLVGGKKYTYGTAAPTTGTWNQGDHVANSAPAVGSPKGWFCTVAGSPGTWVSEGNL